jgi:membrane protein
LLLVAVAVAGFVYGSVDAQSRLVAEIEPVVGSEVASLVSDLLGQAAASRRVTGIIGVVLMSWTASALFLEAQGSLDLVFGGNPHPKTGVRAWIVRRLLALGAALSMGLVLLAVSLSGTLWRLIESGVDWSEPLKQGVAWLAPVVGWIVLAALFTLMFRFVPSRVVPWRPAVIGGTLTGIGFAFAALVVGSYFNADRFTGTGFAGGFVLILFSVYVLAQVVLLGAEIIDVHFLDEPRPEELNAESMSSHEPAVGPAERPVTVIGWFAAGLAMGAYLVSRVRSDK